MTNILALPPISGAYTLPNNSDWRTSWRFPSSGTAIDISGIAFHLQARPAPGSPEIDLDLSTAGGALTNGGASGTLALIVLASALAEVPPGAYVADLIASADGATINLCASNPLTITVTGGVTC